MRSPLGKSLKTMIVYFVSKLKVLTFIKVCLLMLRSCWCKHLFVFNNVNTKTSMNNYIQLEKQGEVHRIIIVTGAALYICMVEHA